MSSEFHTTRWSIVVAASGRDDEERDALGWLFEAYRDPLYAFVRRRGLAPDDASDTVQAFFLSLMERDGFRNLDPAAGRFRAFLLASIKHFLANRRAHERAEKRRAQNPSFTVSLTDAEHVFRTAASSALDAEAQYEKGWALTVFRRAMERLETEFREAGRGDVYARLQGFLTGEGDASYREVAEDLGMAEGGVKTTVHRMRKRLGRHMRDEVAQTIADPTQVDDEIRYHLEVLG